MADLALPTTPPRPPADAICILARRIINTPDLETMPEREWRGCFGQFSERELDSFIGLLRSIADQAEQENYRRRYSVK